MENPASGDLVESKMSMGTVFVIVPPLISLLFLLIAKSMSTTKLKDRDSKQIILFGMPASIAALIIIYLDIIPSFNAFILAAALIIACIWPVITFKKRYADIMDAESASPNILRDIAETTTCKVM